MGQVRDRELTEEVRKPLQPIGIAEVAHGDIHRRSPLQYQITHSSILILKSQQSGSAGVMDTLSVPDSDRSGAIPCLCRGR
jgi:hypothetical protein